MKHRFVLLAGIALLCWMANGCSSDNPPTNDNGGIVLEAPSNLTAAWVSQTQILLRWRDNSSGEDGFEIFESIGGDSSFQLITTAAANADSAVISNRNPTLLYVYKVRATKGLVRSDFSSSVRVGGGSLYKTLRPAEGGPVQTVSYSPVGTFLAAGYGNNRIIIWDASSGGLVRLLAGHTSPVEWLCYSPGGSRIASQAESVLRVWNVGTGETIYTLQGQHPVYSPDNRYLAISADSSIYLLNPINFDTLRILRSVENVPFKVVGFSSDGRWMVANRVEGIGKWDMQDSTAIRPVRQFGNYPSGALACSSSGNYFVAKADSSSLVVIRMDNGVVVTLRGGVKGCYSAAFSPDETVVATSWGDWSIRIWNVETGELTRVLSGHTYIPYQVAWSPDGVYLASASGDMTVKIWGPFK